MSVAPEKVKQENEISIEIDGKPLKARRGDMIIEVADAADIVIPRFCYHKKLSIAANCRMCLIEVDKIPKPLPACATPVADGMKVYTRSPKAIEAQKGTMEFLLINHPLDCPICDQGGECELQEMSIGFGADRSEYDEAKRVVRDKDIGPLIETEMTRCIHCTLCVRFGEEVAGIRELGATGRGENMRIGTYIERAVSSEMSGNVIDLCPVGALTSKPFRYTARAWELQRRNTIAPHDCVGSNLTALVRAHKVMRVDPRDNDQINECWISDRDRFSYQALNSPGRLLYPMIKRDGQWEQTDWNTALESAVMGLKQVIDNAGAGQFGTLVSPNATVEEMYLTQRLVRGLGSENIDHRLRQADFRDQHQAPVFPWLGRPVESLERVDAALLIGSYVRKAQPIIAHRLRKAALKGASIMFLNPVAYEFNFPVAENLVMAPAAMEQGLAAIAKAVLEVTGTAPPAGYQQLLRSVRIDESARRIAKRLAAAEDGVVLLGDLAHMHPGFSTLRALGQVIADAAGLPFGYLSDGANSAGASLAGILPHRAPGGGDSAAPGFDARAMFEKRLKAFLLLNTEPEYDSADPGSAVDVLREAQCVVALTPFDGESMRDYADIMLPITPFTETSGTYVNVEGRWQTFTGVATPAGEARPAWKVLRVLGNLFIQPGFEYMSSDEVRDELRRAIGDLSPSNATTWSCPESLSSDDGESVQRVGHVPIYAVDNIVRRADALQQTVDARESARLRIPGALAQRLGLEEGVMAVVRQGKGQAELPVVIDDRIAANCALIPAGLSGTRHLGPLFGPVTLEKSTDG